MGKILGIDLGTANTLVCMKGRGIVLRCPSVVAISRATRDVVAIGTKARSMLGKTPEGILAIRPMRDGVIADPDVTAKMLRIFFEQTDAISFFSRPSVIASVPHGVTEVEKRAVEDAIFEAGARSVALIDEPIAAAIGTGLRVQGVRGSMIVDIGGGTTEVAVISLGGISETSTLRVAGNAFDEAIVTHLRRHRDVLIGTTGAEDLKLGIGSAHPSVDRGEMEICGRNLRTGLGAILHVQSSEIRDALSEHLEQISRTILSTLEQTPPELSSDIYDFGIMLTGGGSMLPGIDRMISERTGLRVTRAKRPLESVANGILRVIDTEGEMGSLLRYRGR